MKKLLSAPTLFLAVVLVSFTLPVDLEKRSLLDNKIEISLPSHFTVMSEEMLKAKYPGGNRPKLVYTDENGTINIAFNHTTSKATLDQLEVFKDVLVKTMKASQEDGEWLGDGIREVNGRKIGYAELITQAIDTKVYNHVFFTVLDGRLLICSFNCTEKYMKEWKPIAAEIISSLKIK